MTTILKAGIKKRPCVIINTFLAELDEKENFKRHKGIGIKLLDTKVFHKPIVIFRQDKYHLGYVILLEEKDFKGIKEYFDNFCSENSILGYLYVSAKRRCVSHPIKEVASMNVGELIRIEQKETVNRKFWIGDLVNCEFFALDL